MKKNEKAEQEKKLLMASLLKNASALNMQAAQAEENKVDVMNS
jgi:hypothetical protein